MPMNKNGINNHNCTHGLSKTRIYRTYHHMKDRCYRKTNKDYKHYGGRGIKICQEWLENNGFENFKEWAFENGYKDNLTIERKDVNGDYCPENCCWIPFKKQMANRTNQNIIEYKGETHYLSEWSEILGIRQDTLWRRIFKFGWSVDKAFETPVQIHRTDVKCSVPNCNRKHKARGYCSLHYQRFMGKSKVPLEQ